MKSIVRLNALKAHKLFNCRQLSSLVSETTNKLSPEVLSQYESVIGLEVHSQIASKSKLFSSANTSYLSVPNSQVSYFDSALPGTLPVLNRKCVQSAVLTGLALNCQISRRSEFDRKHYFYADMPAGYQITQQRHPLATNGFIEFVVLDQRKGSNAYMKRSALKQIQLEQDSGKSLQDEANNRALVDLNRAGVGLMEFVFEPDLTSAAEAVCLVRELVSVLTVISTCTCKMEEGVLRVDANISVRKPGQPLGVRTEVKNLNSFRFIHSAIEYEIDRQIAVIESGGQVMNETLMYDMKLKRTVPMRDKEVVQDYRFMPEPNLPPILLCDDNDLKPDLINISDFKREISSKQMPNQLRDYLCKDFGLSLAQIFVLMSERGMTRVFIDVSKQSQSKQFNTIFAFIDTDLRSLLEELKQNFELCSVDPKLLSEIIDLLVERQISSRIANRLTELYFRNEKRTPIQLINENNWQMIRDEELIRSVCLATIESHPKIARKYAKTGIRKPHSLLIENVLNQLDSRLNESDVWLHYDRLLRHNQSVEQK